MAMGLGLVFWMFLLFSPLAWVGQAKADDTESYGTVIGIVGCPSTSLRSHCRKFKIPRSKLLDYFLDTLEKPGH